MKAQTIRLAAVLAAGLLILALACDSSETIAPDGSTISLTANPAQVIILGGQQVGDVQILATVRNSIGVPLPGQDVRFTTTSGRLVPPVGTPIATDDSGNATCTLTSAGQGPQITATSGKATASLTLSAGSALVAFLTLSPSDPQTFQDCNETIDFTVTASDINNAPVENVRIFFEPLVANQFSNFDPPNDVTDAAGMVLTTLKFNSQCDQECIDPKNCSFSIHAKDQAGLVFSNVVQINDGVE